MTSLSVSSAIVVFWMFYFLCWHFMLERIHCSDWLSICISSCGVYNILRNSLNVSKTKKKSKEKHWHLSNRKKSVCFERYLSGIQFKRNQCEKAVLIFNVQYNEVFEYCQKENGIYLWREHLVKKGEKKTVKLKAVLQFVINHYCNSNRKYKRKQFIDFEKFAVDFMICNKRSTRR